MEVNGKYLTLEKKYILNGWIEKGKPYSSRIKGRNIYVYVYESKLFMF